MHVAHAHGGCGYRWGGRPESLADMKAKVTEAMTACSELIEREFIEGPWVLGERFSICDPYLLTVSAWLERDAVDRASFPKFDEQARLMMERPSTGAAWTAALPSRAVGGRSKLRGYHDGGMGGPGSDAGRANFGG